MTDHFYSPEDGLERTEEERVAPITRHAMWSSLRRSVFGAIARIFSDQQGASGAIVAIALPGLIGFGALGAETGVWFTVKLQNQSAADAAAISAAYEIIAGKTDTTTELTPAAGTAAGRNGYKGSTPIVTYPYSDTTVGSGVAVTLQQRQEALLAAMFLTGVTVTTKAVAVIEVLDNPCVLALGASGTAVEVTDSARLAMPTCSVAANSTSRSAIDLHSGTSSIAAETLVTQGEVSFQGSPIDPALLPLEFALASAARIGAPSVADPYTETLTHDFLIAGIPITGKCKSKTVARIRVYDGRCVLAGAALTATQIRLSAETQISGGWDIPTGHIVDLTPGTYWVTGDLTIQATGVLKCSTCDNLTGAGVTIILTTLSNKIGTVAIAPTASVALNAPSTGLFPGVVLIQDGNRLPRGTTYTSGHSTITGATGATLNGLVYLPNSSMTFLGSPSTAGPRCLLLVVNTLTVEGPSSLEAGGCTRVGLAKLPIIHTVALAE